MHPILALAAVALGLAIYYGAFDDMGKSVNATNIKAATYEPVEINRSVVLWKQNNSSTKSYASVNAETVAPYMLKQMELGGSGDSSYFCSDEFGCDVKYYISGGNGDTEYNLFVDASNLQNSWTAQNIELFENATLANMKTVDSSIEIKNDATAIAAQGTTPAQVTTDDNDLQFMLLKLGKV